MFSTFLRACSHAFHTFFRENTRRKQPATKVAGFATITFVMSH